jgi:hypothetical protein
MCDNQHWRATGAGKRGTPCDGFGVLDGSKMFIVEYVDVMYSGEWLARSICWVDAASRYPNPTADICFAALRKLYKAPYLETVVARDWRLGKLCRG